MKKLKNNELMKHLKIAMECLSELDALEKAEHQHVAELKTIIDASKEIYDRIRNQIISDSIKIDGVSIKEQSIRRFKKDFNTGSYVELFGTQSVEDLRLPTLKTFLDRCSKNNHDADQHLNKETQHRLIIEEAGGE